MTALAFTVGHSSHDAEAFLALLRMREIDLVADVRSSPFSRFAPQFSREPLRETLGRAGIAYSFYGRELGGRPADPACYVEGRVQYSLLARTALFQEGLARLRAECDGRRVAMVCAEKDPLDCHRGLLLAPRLAELGVEVWHILADGTLESLDRAMDRLLDAAGLPRAELFRSRRELIDAALEARGARVAHEAEIPSAPQGMAEA